MEIHLKKNEAAYITFPMVTTATPDAFITGETVTDTAYSKDGAGAWTTLAITDAVTEIASTGMYSIDLTAAEMNHDLIAIKFTSTSGADTMVMIRTYAVDVDDLVRSTTPANTLDVTATGGVDVELWDGVDLSTTNPLPNAAAGAAGGLPTDSTGKTSFNDITAAQVNTEVSDVLKTDTITLPGQVAPPATPTFEQALSYIYKFLRNRKTATSTQISIYDDAGTTVDHKSTISDDGTTYTEGEYSAGP